MKYSAAFFLILLIVAPRPAVAQFSASQQHAHRGPSTGRVSGSSVSDRLMRQTRPRRPRKTAKKQVKISPKNATISFADLSAPKKAKKAFDKGRRQMTSGHMVKAKASLEKAVAIHPEYASAWYFLGRIYRREDYGKAWQAYQNAVGADPKSWRAYAGMADLAAASNDWPRLAETSGTALRLMPLASSRLYVQNAAARYSLGDLNGAERSAREALERTWRRPDPRAYRLLGLVDAQRGRWASAANHLRQYIEFAPNADNLREVRGELAYVEAQHRKLTGEKPEFVLHPSGMLVRTDN